MTPTVESTTPFGIAWGQVYGMQHRLVSQPAETFMPQLRHLGATAVRLNLYWGQLEPEPGRYVWDALDTFLAQLTSADEAWLVLATSSPWATRKPSELIPSAPALDPERYAAFVRAVVARCGERITYWQMEFEVGGPFWAGTAREYVAQLAVFARAVRSVDAHARIVLAGFLDDAYDREAARARSTQPSLTVRTALFRLVSVFLRRRRLSFYRTLLRDAAEHCDILDLHLYQNAYTVPATIAFFRRAMAAYGYERPIFIGEYNGPAFVDFPENMASMPTVMRAMHKLSASLNTQDAAKVEALASGECAAMSELYGRMASLPPQTQMFMEECPPELEAKRNRINCRDLVMRNLLAISAGAVKTFCFNLAPDLAGRTHQVLNLMFNKYRLMDYADGRLTTYLPPAEAYRRMTGFLSGVESVTRINVPDIPAVYLFTIERRSGTPLLVVWERRDAYTGEDAPSTGFEWPWPAPGAHATDALGQNVPVDVRSGRVCCRISVTPTFIEASHLHA